MMAGSFSGAEYSVEVEGVSKSFGQLQVLDGVRLRVPTGTVACIVGPSGAGKSTLLQIIGSLQGYDAGRVRVGGVEVRPNLKGRELSHFRNRQVGFIFQFYHLLPEFTALENAMIPALLSGESFGSSRSRARGWLERLGLGGRLDHRPGELSGGEQQRVAVVRALMNEPAVILADEPTGNLDSANREELHELFFALCRELGQTFLIVTHDVGLADQADVVIRLRDGRVE